MEQNSIFSDTLLSSVNSAAIHHGERVKMSTATLKFMPSTKTSTDDENQRKHSSSQILSAGAFSHLNKTRSNFSLTSPASLNGNINTNSPNSSTVITNSHMKTKSSKTLNKTEKLLD